MRRVRARMWLKRANRLAAIEQCETNCEWPTRHINRGDAPMCPWSFEFEGSISFISLSTAMARGFCVCCLRPSCLCVADMRFWLRVQLQPYFLSRGAHSLPVFFSAFFAAHHSASAFSSGFVRFKGFRLWETLPIRLPGHWHEKGKQISYSLYSL